MRKESDLAHTDRTPATVANSYITNPQTPVQPAIKSLSSSTCSPDSNDDDDDVFSDRLVIDLRSTPEHEQAATTSRPPAVPVSKFIYPSIGTDDSEMDNIAILDDHIKNTLDQISDQADREIYYRPVKQEPYINVCDDEPSPTLDSLINTAHSYSSSPGGIEADSGFSASPEPEQQPQPPTYPSLQISTTQTTSTTSLRPIPDVCQFSNSFINPYPMDPLYLQHHMNYRQGVLPKDGFHDTPNTNLHYLPSIWGDLHSLRNAYRAEQLTTAQTTPSQLNTPPTSLFPSRSYDRPPQLPSSAFQAFAPSGLSLLPMGHRPVGPNSLTSLSSHDPVTSVHLQSDPDRLLMLPYQASPNSLKVKATASWRVQCKQCNKKFNCNTNLELHIDSAHRGVRPFECKHCNKTFAQRATLRTHMRVHTGQRPYSCNICDRRFADLSTCKKHQRVHDGQKPYQCDICLKSFSQSGNMLRHKEGHKKDDQLANSK